MIINIKNVEWLLLDVTAELSMMLVAALLGVLPSEARAEHLVSGNTKVFTGESPPNYFFKSNFLRCGGRDVLISTSCVDAEEALAYCFNQIVSVYDAKTNSVSSQKYDYTFDKGNQQFIADAACVSAGGKEYLVLGSTNFGNCETCEWIDVYSPQGKYLGSSPGMYRNSARNFAHFPLPKLLDSLLSSSMAKEIDSVKISRVR